MTTLENVTDYIILKVTEDGTNLSVLKLQKLVYYAQAWYLAFSGTPLFRGAFEAWVHGPVSRDLYKRFASRTMYAPVSLTDIRHGFNPMTMSEMDRRHIDNVLEVYADLTGSQLEEMSHREDPWIEARGDTPEGSRCVTEISEKRMASYYRSRIDK